MKSIVTSRKIIIFMLLTVFLICGVQGVGYGGELFWGLGAGLGAAGEGIGAGFGAVGEGLGAAGEGLGAAWEAFDAVGEAFGVHPVELIATGGISVILRYIPLPDANVVGQVRGASNIFVIPDGGPIGLVVSGSVHFWDPHAEQFAAPLIHGAPIFNFVVSPDGGLLATTSEGGNVQLWSRNADSADSSWVPSGQQLNMTLAGYTTWAQLKLEPKIHVLSTAFSPDGEILAGGSARGTVRLWNATTGGLRTTLRGHTDSVTSIAFSPDGGLLATASADGTVRLWHPGTGDLQATLSGHTGSVLSVDFSRASGFLASASIDGTVRLWNPNTGEQEATLDHESPVLDIAFSPEGDVLASANVNGSVRLWDPDTRRVQALLGHGSPVTTVAFGRDKHSVITGSRDGLIRQWEVWDVADSGPEILTASTASPLTESTIHGSVVTLTLNRLAYAPARGIRDPVKVSGIAGETVDTSNIWRVNDTELTVELEFNGDIDTDANITFTVEANAVAGYFGPPLTAQIPVTAVTETVVASTASPLTEPTLDGSVVILTLSGRTYARSSFDIREALNVSGVRAVTVERFDVDRVSDTEVAVELEFKGDIDEDAILTFTVGADAIAGYGGTALTVQLPVTASMESVSAATTSPLTERTLDGNVVTLTLNGRSYAQSRVDIGKAVKVSGVRGLAVEWFDVDRVSDTEITVELEFNDDIDEDATLTFTVGADAIAGYGGTALTAQLPVTAYTESVAASTPSPLTEATLNGSAVTLSLNGRGFVESIWDIRRALKVSGISRATVDASNIKRVSDTAVTVAIEFNGDIDADANLTFTVGKDAIANYNGPALAAQLPVTAYTESVAASTASPLSGGTLNGSVVTLTLSGRDYARSIFDIRDAVEVAGINGVTIPWHQPDRKSDTQITVRLEFNGDIDTDATLTFTVGAGAIADYNGPALTAQISVSTEAIPVEIDNQTPEPPKQLDGTDARVAFESATPPGYTRVTLRDTGRVWGVPTKYTTDSDAGTVAYMLLAKLMGCNFANAEEVRQSKVYIKTQALGRLDNFASETACEKTSNQWRSAWNGVRITHLRFFDESSAPNIKEAVYSAATGRIELARSVTAWTTSPLTEATLEGSVVTLTLSGCTFERSIFDIRDAVTVAGIDGVTMPWHQPDRKSDTKITIAFEFDGDMDADGTLTFTVGADAIANYNGPALTAQLSVTASKDNALAANFPNPFNPETWIPYQLARDADVMLTIHALDGQLVRLLPLGVQPAGTYYSRSRAAYWNGKNEFGEPVASGLYFYTLTAGDFSATRKMLIRK